MRLLSLRQSSAARASIVLALCGFLLSSLSTSRVQAAAGNLDPTFGTGGKVTTDFSGNPVEARGVVLQPDGKIIAAGIAFDPITRGDFGLVRYNQDGSIDSSFGSGGKVTTDFLNIPSFGSVDFANALALQTDGKIVVAGFSAVGVASFALARYRADGSLDSSFGSGGKVTTSFSRFDAVADDVAIQSDGKIIAVGSVNTSFSSNPKPDFALARYNSDGGLDSTFGVGGKVTTDFTDFTGVGDNASAVVIQPDGKIVVVGSSQVSLFAPDLRQFSIARYNIDGTLDLSFGVGGKVRPFFFGQFDQANAVALIPDGRIIVAGFVSNFNLPSESDFGMVRLNSDGSTDTSFGSNGKVVTDFSSEFDSANSIAVQPNGKIVLAGVVSKGTFQDSTDFAIAQYNANGSLDAAFGSGGRVTTDFFGFSNEANAVVIQQDGRILVAGRADSGEIGPPFRFALARYDGNSFDMCLQDDSNGNLLQFNSTTGDYQFTNCTGFTLGGTGVISTRGSIITLQQNGPDRRVLARIDGGVNKGTASVQILSLGTTFTITDRNTLNNTCSCVAH
jgi:uncharacterized delta-60 repeat protein